MRGLQEFSPSSDLQFTQERPQADTFQGNGQVRLSRAPSSSRSARNATSLPDTPDHTSFQRPRGKSIGPSSLNRWQRQKPIDESWNHVSRGVSSGRGLHDDAAITDALRQLQITESEQRTRGVANSHNKGSGGGINRHSSNQNWNSTSKTHKSGANDCTGRADGGRGSGAAQVKNGQLSIGKNALPYFACFCCKRRALAARANGIAIPPTVKLCPCVQWERPVRRTSAPRHIRTAPRPQRGEISQEQHDELMGPGYKRARDAAKERGLEGRAKDEFLYREGFVTLNPSYARVKHRLDPFSYWDENLDPQTIRQIEGELHPTPRIPSPVSEPLAGSYARVAAGNGQGEQSNPGGVRPVSRGSSYTHMTVQDGPQRGQPLGTTPQLYARPIFGRHSPFPQHQVAEEVRFHQTPYTPQRHGPAPPPQRYPVPHQIPAAPSFDRHGPPTQLVTQGEFWHANQPHPPGLRHTSTTHRPTQPSMEDFCSPHVHPEGDQMQAAEWETTRVPGHPERRINIPSTPQRRPSTQMQSVPSLAHGATSTNTGHTSYFAPRTPRDPESPTPISRHGDGVIDDLRLKRFPPPPGTVNPRDLQIVPEENEMTHELEGMSRPRKRARD